MVPGQERKERIIEQGFTKPGDEANEKFKTLSPDVNLFTAERHVMANHIE
jgi:hypothetical protein